MKKEILFATWLISCSFQTLGFDESSYVKNLKAGGASTQSDAKVLSVLDYCSANQMAPDCVLPQLTNLVQSENNTLASSILNEYARSQAEGKVNKLPECKTQRHLDTNFVLGRCLFVMNYTALKEQNKDSAISTFQTCLQGGLIGLAYDGNMSAQYLLSQVFKSHGIAQSAQVWEKSLEFKKGSAEDLLMRKCYM